MNDPYETPSAGLHATNASKQGSLRKAIDGNYDFSLTETIRSAWQLVEGAKLPLNIATIIPYGLAWGIGSLFNLGGLNPESYFAKGQLGQGMLYAMLPGLVAMPLTMPLYAGLMVMGIKRTSGSAVSMNTLTMYFPKVVPLVITGISMSALIYLGMLLFILPGIYLSVAYMFAIPLVVDKNLGPWQALEASRTAVTHHWFKTFGFLLALLLILIAGALLLFIGLIWAVPLFVIAYGMLYRTVFGIEANTLGQ